MRDSDAGLGQSEPPAPAEGFRLQATATRARKNGDQSGPRADLPLTPTTFVPLTTALAIPAAAIGIA